MSLALALLLLAGAQAQPAPAAPQPTQAQAAAAVPVYGYRIVATYPHDTSAFTQGLTYVDGHLYESTGHVGRSTIRRVRIEDGRVLQSVPVPPPHFGEGSVNWGNQIISVTWQGGVGFRWDKRTLRQVGTFRYPGEGWGLTQNGRDLILSDGTPTLRFLDPRTMTERRRLQVTLRGQPLRYLNELEWVRGEIFANVWMQNAIVRIDPNSGAVTGVINLTDLARANQGGDNDSVLNGIAYDAQRDRLFVTGKNWPRLYEIDLVPPAGR